MRNANISPCSKPSSPICSLTVCTTARQARLWCVYLRKPVASSLRLPLPFQHIVRRPRNHSRTFSDSQNGFQNLGSYPPFAFPQAFSSTQNCVLGFLANHLFFGFCRGLPTASRFTALSPNNDLFAGMRRRSPSLKSCLRGNPRVLRLFIDTGVVVGREEI